MYSFSEIHRQRSSLPNNYKESLLIRRGKTLTPVAVKDILWIETDSPYLAVHTLEGSFLYSSSIADTLANLDPQRFARIHRSVVINLGCIDKITSRLNGDYDIRLTSGKILRMSRTYSKQVKNILKLAQNHSSQ